MSDKWDVIEPEVSKHAEFREIAGDFGDPLEIVREAISNSFDAKASYIKIKFSVEQINGYDKLVIEFDDDGNGMSREKLEDNFWDLGNSASRGDKTKIGEKGHGTKIYLRSDKIIVRTYDGECAYESICDHAFADLSSGKLHSPKIREIEPQENKGTFIRIEGYNNSVQPNYSQLVVKDYIYWFTKLGSFETHIPGKTIPNFKVELKCLDVEEYETLSFGHIFPEENKDINELFNKYEWDAADYFVKKYEYLNQRLEGRIDVTYDAIIYVEGNEAKNNYNPMLKKRKNKISGSYKVSDRYGLWLCKDYIPVQNINSWIIGFGTGSNSTTLLHGFINCQKLNLTANRGSIANTDPEITKKIKEEVNKILDEINIDLYKNEMLTLQKWQNEKKTLRLEESQFDSRKEKIANRSYFKIDNRTFLVPRNESELFGLFISLYTKYPEKFDFEPLDYDTTQGIDIIARNKTDNLISDCEYWYIELKHQLSVETFNHSFKNIRWIVCWDISKQIKHGTILSSIVEEEKREFHIEEKEGRKIYSLDSPGVYIKIMVIKLKDFIINQLGIEIKNPNER